jgi:hypothetical protein
VNLTPGQVDRISQLSNEWSFFWDKRRTIWIAAEDCPDGEQIEEADLDALLAQLPTSLGQAGSRQAPRRFCLAAKLRSARRKSISRNAGQ